MIHIFLQKNYWLNHQLLFTVKQRWSHGLYMSYCNYYNNCCGNLLFLVPSTLEQYFDSLLFPTFWVLLAQGRAPRFYRLLFRWGTDIEPRFHRSKATQELEVEGRSMRQKPHDQGFERQTNLLAEASGIFPGDCGEPQAAAAVVLVVSSTPNIMSEETDLLQSL